MTDPTRLPRTQRLTEQTIRKLQRRVTGLETALDKARTDLVAGTRPSRVIADLDAAVHRINYDVVKSTPMRPRKFHRARPEAEMAPATYVSGPWQLRGTPDLHEPTRNVGPWTVCYEGVVVMYEGDAHDWPLRTDRYSDAVKKIHAIESGTFPQRLVIPAALRALQAELTAQEAAESAATALLDRSPIS